MIVISILRVLVVECLLLQHKLMLKFLRERLLHIFDELCKESLDHETSFKRGRCV